MKLIFTIFLALFILGNSFAGGENRINGELKVYDFRGNRFDLYESDISPAIEVDINSENYSYSTPIEAASSFERAMRKGDFAQHLESWDEKSKKDILKRNKENGRNQEFWINIWSKRTTQRSFLHKQAQYKEYVLISKYYVSSSGKKCCTVTVLTRTKNNDWRVTNNLASSQYCIIGQTHTVHIG